MITLRATKTNTRTQTTVQQLPRLKLNQQTTDTYNLCSSQLDQEMNGLLSPRCLKIHPKNVKLVQFDALLIDCTYNQILLICREKNT